MLGPNWHRRHTPTSPLPAGISGLPHRTLDHKSTSRRTGRNRYVMSFSPHEVFHHPCPEIIGAYIGRLLSKHHGQFALCFMQTSTSVEYLSQLHAPIALQWLMLKKGFEHLHGLIGLAEALIGNRFCARSFTVSGDGWASRSVDARCRNSFRPPSRFGFGNNRAAASTTKSG